MKTMYKRLAPLIMTIPTGSYLNTGKQMQIFYNIPHVDVTTFATLVPF